MLSLDQTRSAALVFVGMVAVIATVLAFQHIGGYIPCKLCLQQRQPYYAAMPLAAIAFLSIRLGWSPALSRLLLAIVALLLMSTAALAAYHAGVEWRWWAGPADCGATAGNISNDVGDLLDDLTSTRPPACDEAALRILGLSFAGWNVIASAGLACIALIGALDRRTA